MNDSDYLKLSAKTLSECDRDQKTIGKRILRGILLNALTDVSADCLKREIFYKDANAKDRHDEEVEALLKLEESFDKLPKTIELTNKQINLLHAFFGLESEAGEIGTELLNSILENRDVDMVNMREEVGDCKWYLGIVARECEFTFSEAMQYNIDKLEARYGESFSCEAAINRDLEKEREVLEKTD